MLARLTGVAVVLAAALPGFADEVVLRNGAVFAGIVREEGDQVILEVDCGTITFRRNEVREVRRTEDPLKELERRLAGASDAPGYYELGLWAREKGLATRAEELFRKAISLDPDHEGARKALGYERFGGRWLSGDELMAAKGYMKHEGRWLKRETVERLLQQEHAERLERDRREAEERIARMRREVELERLAVERERAEWERGRFHLHWVGGFPGVVVPLRRPPPPARPGAGDRGRWERRRVEEKPRMDRRGGPGREDES